MMQKLKDFVDLGSKLEFKKCTLDIHKFIKNFMKRHTKTINCPIKLLF